MNTNAKKSQAVTTKVYSDKKVKIMRFIGMVLIAAIILTIPVFASANYGEKGGTYILGELWWVGVVAVAGIAIKFFASGNYMKLLITVIAGVLVLAMIGAPESLKTIGNNIWSTAFGG